jgi:osmotically-inducible protein OsmY
MKTRYAITAAATLAFAMGVAQGADYGAGSLKSDNAFHSGAMTYDDQVLVDRVVAALETDRRLRNAGITATVTAKDGKVSIGGTARSDEEAIRAQQVAKEAAGPGNFATGFFTS